MKITQFCIPAPGEMVALTDAGDLWERFRDPKDMNTGPGWRPRYLWRRLDGPVEEITKTAKAKTPAGDI